MRIAAVAVLAFIALRSCSSPAFAQTPPASPSTQTPPTAFASITPPTWMRVGIEHRGRLEGITGAGFADNRDDLYWLNRFRVTARISVKPWLSAAVQAQDARIEGRNGATTGAPFRDQLDLRLAHVDIGAFDKSRFALRGGRQELVFGDQRLVGHGNWLNTARSFDGVRGVFRHKKLRVDGFVASVVAIQMDDANRSGHGNYLYGADAPLTVLPYGGVIEPYVFARTAEKLPTETGSVGDLTSATSGVRIVGKLSARTDYNLETAIQRGSLGSDTIAASAAHALVGRTIPVGAKTYRAFGEYNFASGDDTPGDGARGTFDQLYPTGHDKYGLADQVGWKNIHHLRTGVEARLHAKLALAGSYHSFWLASATDALYSAGGAILARIHTGSPDRHVGQELDIQAAYTPSPRIQLTGGYAHMFTGAFLKAATPGRSYTAPYVMVTTMLLGLEK
ncbi:MAG TPA: alginate export family protein [Vicinamibacterales bacterium]|nr:alginate export family protein [Vicinamibacterales bacterium]